jgi:integrase
MKKKREGVFQPTYRDKRTGEKKKAGVWWIKWGCRHTCGNAACSGVHRENTGSTNQADAVKLRQTRLGEVGRGRVIGPDVEKTTFEDLAKMIDTDYQVNARKSTERLAASLKHLREAFGSSRALSITTDRVREYIVDRQKAGAMPATIRAELAALKRMFTLGVQAGKVAQRPHIPSIEVRNTRTGFFEVEDFRSVQVHLPEDLQPLAEFFYLTGWRKEEALGLTWPQVDFKAGEVRLEVGTTKNDDGRVFPFSVYPPLGELLRRQRERTSAVEKAKGRIVSQVFHRNGRPIRDYYAAWRKACKEAGIPGRLVHDFRRTAVRNLERAGVSRSVAMKLTGHKTEAVYRRYAIVSPADLRAGVEKLAAALAAEERTAVPRVVIVPVERKRRA